MEILNVTTIFSNARQRLVDKAYRRMAMIHTGALVALALVVTMFQFVLAEGIGNTGGLSGMGRRAMLETIQTILQGANTVLQPFWNLGFLFVALQWYRGRDPHERELLTGFRRIGPCIGLLVNRMLLSIFAIILALNIGSVLFAGQLTEMMGPLDSTEAMYAYMESMTNADLLNMGKALLPMLIASGVICLVLLVPLLYRFRLAEYVILDNKGMRGFGAMVMSAALLHRRCWQLVKVDLRFWWYYGLKILCTVLCYLDSILLMAGVELPVGENAAYILAYALYLAALFGVEVAFRPMVDTVYAGVYEEVKAMGPVMKKPVPVKPEQMPWNEE